MGGQDEPHVDVIQHLLQRAGLQPSPFSRESALAMDTRCGGLFEDDSYWRRRILWYRSAMFTSWKYTEKARTILCSSPAFMPSILCLSRSSSPGS
jgi:hypothetical protein